MSDLVRNPKQVGNIIRRARKKLSLSQQELSEKVGLRQATISAIENGHPAVRFDSLLALLAALDLEFQVAPRTTSSDQGMESYFNGP